MAEEYTPRTEDVRRGYASDPEAEYRDPVGYPAWERQCRAMFDRWLAAHDAEIRESANAKLRRVEQWQAGMMAEPWGRNSSDVSDADYIRKALNHLAGILVGHA